MPVLTSSSVPVQGGGRGLLCACFPLFGRSALRRSIRIVPLLLVLAACTDHPITDPSPGERAASAVEVHTSSSAAWRAKQSSDSRATGPVPDIHVTGSYSASTGTGSVVVSQSGPGARSPEASATPTALSWTPTTLTVTYASVTQTYDLNQDEQDLLRGLQQEEASTQGGSANFRALLSRGDLTLEEARDFFVSQGYAARPLDADRLELQGSLALPQAGTGTHEIRHVFNVRTLEMERSDLYRSNRLVYAHGPSRLRAEGARRVP